ncbi:uncharacterized protein LOC131620201 [Vicia villosa]|uniref:uncharacterized protein LOC131620201 n=1 Tax=Vicia villosa TaxID=3911 RepID=UPI00273AC4BF|nr:uncharacterized protein LOC131620201 [Vicia villosa]
MKVLLRGFELVSGLKINFHKSNIFGVYIGEWLSTSTTFFLACKRGTFPFKFLGIWVGEGASKRRVWKDVVSNIKSRLSMWKGRNIFIGGRVTLIGSWENVCKPKEKGGLGIRDVGEMNKSLILKWKWRILKEDKAIWSTFLLLRYQNPKFKVLASCVEVLNRDDSSWWRDIILNDFKEEDSVEGFIDWVNCDFKKGNTILFWHSCWLGDQTLCVSFSYLFDLSTNKLCKVSEVISWNNGAYSWNLDVLFGNRPVTNGIASAFDIQLRD